MAGDEQEVLDRFVDVLILDQVSKLCDVFACNHLFNGSNSDLKAITEDYRGLFVAVALHVAPRGAEGHISQAWELIHDFTGLEKLS